MSIFHTSSLSSTHSIRGFRIGVVLLLDWLLPTKAAEPSLPKDVWLFRSSHFFPLSPSDQAARMGLNPASSTWWDFGEVLNLRPMYDA